MFKMKYSIIVLGFLFQFLQLSAQNKLSISGKTSAFEDGDTVSISAAYPFNTFFSYPIVKNSSVIKNGEFHLLLKRANSELFDISIKKRNAKKVSTRIFLEPSDTKIKFRDSLLKYKTITGNKGADDYASFSKEIQKIKPPRVYFALWNQYDSARNINSALAARIYGSIDSISKVVGQNQALVAKEWMNNHSGSLLNSYILYYFLRPYISDDSLKMEFERLPDEAKKNSRGMELKYIVNNAIIGAKAPGFVEDDTSGNKISLSDFTGKGNYILIDFWASWCGPCREANPALRSIYSEFKNKDLAIIGISLDKSKDGWIEAIKKDSLPWTQLSDLQFWNNKAAKAYYLRSIPSNFLLDSKGKIIARNLSMAELRMKLNHCLNIEN